MTFLLMLVSILSSQSIRAQVTVTATAGTPGPSNYTTLKSSFDAINAGTHQGVVTITITGNTTETATAAINASGAGSASYTSVLIKPGTGASPMITGALTSATIIKFNGASNVTIDGSNNGTISRNLTISNTATSGSNVIVIGSVGTTPINNSAVKNTILTNGTTASSAFIVGDAATAGNPGYFSNITIQNNDIRKAYIGLYLYSVVSPLNNNITVSDNNLNSSGANALRLVGIYAQGLKGLTVSNNTIGNFESASAEFDRAIWLATATTNTIISGNTISGMAYTGTSSYAPIGINISSGATNSNVQVYDNTVTNLTSSGTGTTMGIFYYSAVSNVGIYRNKISNIKNTNTTGYGAAGMVLATTTNAAASKIYNNFVWDIAAYGYNDYTSMDNGNGIVIDGGGGYDIDYNTIVLNTNQTLTGGHRASCLLVTSLVTAAGAINLRNNIFANLQTVGNANSRLAISNLGPSNVFGTINHNNYYATSGNLSSTGTNASITNTLAQLQTSLGGNGNSASIQPIFVGVNDLHLNTGANQTLNNLAAPIAGITNDIDNDTRSTTTPDMGADEFTYCPVPTITTQPSAAVICEGADTSFSVIASGATSYQWQVNTGAGFTDIANNAIYTGATTATLSITNAPLAYNSYIYRCQTLAQTGCNFATSNTVTLTVNPTPVATITPASTTSLCTGGSVVLNATPGFTYQWLLGNTAIVPPATNASYSTNVAGSYTVIVDNSTTGCSDTSSAVTVTVSAPVSTTQTLNICNNQLPYTWNGQVIPSAGIAVATYTTPSLATGCDSTTTLTLNVNTSTTFTQTVNICHTALPYSWNNQSISVGGTTAATFSTMGSSGCDSITTLNLVVDNGPVSVATPITQSICSGTATSLALTSPTSGATLAWTVAQNGATGATAGAGTSIAQTLTASGTTVGRVIYTIIATANGCAGAAINDTIWVKPRPVITVSPTTQSICSGAATNVALSSSVSNTTFAWTVVQTGLTGGSASNGNNIAQTLTASGFANGTATYTITPSADGCTGTNATATITVTPIPATPNTITGASEPCVGSTQTYTVPTVTGATSYVWAMPLGWTGTSTTNSITVQVGAGSGNVTVRAANTCGNSPVSSKAVVAVPVLTPTVSISSDAPALICSGNLITFTAAISHGGSTPVYQWKLNGNNVGANTNTYSMTPDNGDVVLCVLTSNLPCLTGNQIQSNAISMNVAQSVHPTLNVYVPENNVCSDEMVTFLATPTDGGTTPSYQWKVNNNNVGVNSINYSYMPSDGDLVTCVLNSNALCATPAAVTGNIVPMTVMEITHPSISVAANPGIAVPLGTSVTFTATPLQGGVDGQVTWYKNGVYMANVTGNTWVGIAGTDFANKTEIEARLQSFSPCADPDTVTSNTLKMEVGTTGVGHVKAPENFKLYPNPTYGIVQLEGLEVGDVVSIYDAMGREMKAATIIDKAIYTVDVSAFAQGVYWLRFSRNSGEAWQVKVVKY